MRCSRLVRSSEQGHPNLMCSKYSPSLARFDSLRYVHVVVDPNCPISPGICKSAEASGKGPLHRPKHHSVPIQSDRCPACFGHSLALLINLRENAQVCLKAQSKTYRLVTLDSNLRITQPWYELVASQGQILTTTESVSGHFL